MSPYARAFLRERQIPLLEASPSQRIVASKLHLFDPFESEAAGVLPYIDAAEILIHLSAAPDFAAPELIGLLTSNRKVKIRTASEEAKIWLESQAINCPVEPPPVPELTARSVAALKNSSGARFVGLFCDGLGEEIGKWLRESSRKRLNNLSIYDNRRKDEVRANIVRWISRLSSLHVVTLDDDVDELSKFVVVAAQALEVPCELIGIEDRKGFARIARSAADGANAR
jgi:hypothetical protein